MTRMFVVSFSMMMVAMAHAHQINMAYPEFGRCDERLQEIAKGFWALRGEPNSILDTMENHNYWVALTTFKLRNDTCKVNINTTSKAAEFNVFFNFTNGELEVLSYKNITESGGSVILNERDVIYPITVGNSLISYYVCSPNSSNTDPPMIAVLAKEEYVGNPWLTYAGQLLIRLFNDVLGEDTTWFYNSGQECTFN